MIPRLKYKIRVFKPIYLTTTVFLFTILTGIEAQDQHAISGQKDRLQQYSGNWVSTVHTNTDSISPIPQLIMRCIPKLNKQALIVEVFQHHEDEYQPILLEIISYDPKSNMIRAYGQNKQGDLFMGKGAFKSTKEWVMQDTDLAGNKTMWVMFNFQSFTDVIVEGFDNSNKLLWKTRYIKQNPKDRNIGIQLALVHEDMRQAPIETLIQLGRMGYSFVETFIYSDEGFYGMTPAEFRSAVKQAGMEFLGSMIFHDIPSKAEWNKALSWWEKCIEDHKKAGVWYLSTSNHQIKELTSKETLQDYCDYYNTIGKLCKEKGVIFIYHNPADEFLTVDGVRVYDYFLQNTNPKYVFFQPNLYGMGIGNGNPKSHFKNYPDRFISYRVKYDKELEQSRKIDLKKKSKHVKRKGLKYIVSEIEAHNNPPLYSAGMAWEYIYYTLLKE